MNGPVLVEYGLTALGYGTATAAVAWVLTRFFAKRVPPGVIAALWSLVLLKFLVPMGPSFRFSLSTLLAEMGARVSAQQLVFTEPLEIVVTRHAGPWAAWLVGAWAVIVLGLSSRRLFAHLALMAEVRRWPLLAGGPVPDGAAIVTEALDDAALALGVQRLPAVRIAPSWSGPAVVGFFRPELVLPEQLFAQPLEVVTAVIAHELAHVRRHDAWGRLLQLVAEVVFFFWPPVRWASAQLEHYRELACDHAALSYGALSVTDYARCLLRVRRLESAPAGFTLLEMSSPVSRLERRIDMLLKFKTQSPSSRWNVLLLGAFIVVALTGSAFAAPDASPEEVGALDKELIRKVIHENRVAVRNCYEKELGTNNARAGKVVIGFVISREGTVKDARVKPASTLTGPVANCVSDAVRTWRFPKPAGDGVVMVTYPFIFLNSGE